MQNSVGLQLQTWLIRNKIDVIHDLFVPAVDLAFKNEYGRRGLNEDNHAPVNLPATNSKSRIERELSGDLVAETATSPKGDPP